VPFAFTRPAFQTGIYVDQKKSVTARRDFQLTNDKENASWPIGSAIGIDHRSGNLSYPEQVAAS
jgi:hypothetical protein